MDRSLEVLIETAWRLAASAQRYGDEVAIELLSELIEDVSNDMTEMPDFDGRGEALA